MCPENADVLHLELVDTFVNTQEANPAITNDSNGNLYLRNGGAEKTRTRDPLLAKPITRLLVVKPHLPSCEDALKAYKAVVR